MNRAQWLRKGVKRHWLVKCIHCGHIGASVEPTVIFISVLCNRCGAWTPFKGRPVRWEPGRGWLPHEP